MNPVTLLVAHSVGARAGNPMWLLLAGILLGILFTLAVMRAKPGKRTGFACMLFMLLLLVAGPVIAAQTSHYITLSWTYTQGTTPAVSFVMQRGTVTGGPYAALQTVQLSAVCTAVSGQSGSFTCTANDTAALAAGATSFYTVFAQDGNTPPDQSALSNESSAVWLGSPLVPGQLGATSH